MFRNIIQRFVGDPNKKIIENLRPRVIEVNDLERDIETLTDEELRQRTAELRNHLSAIEDLDELQDVLEDALPTAYALVREASRRTTGLRHYDVQVMGGTLLNQGEIVEMRTGEGKTLVATLPLFLNALAGRGVHLVTVNDYLVRRDGGWMGNIFHLLGLTVGCIGPQQFSALYDPDYVNPGAELEDERLVHWRPSTRREAYMADITYGTSSEFGFDYLRDNMVRDPERLVQRPFYFVVIDEVDNVLIDEARTPLIISGPADEASQDYIRFAGYVRGLRRNTADEDDEPNGHYDIDEKSKSITLTDMGTAKIEERITEIDVDAGESLYDPSYYHLTYYVDNALKAQYMFHRDKDYTVADSEVVIIDDFTGRLMAGRRYSDGLHEAIEAKEGVQVKRESVTVATITIQNYFRMYPKLAGMTGTAMTDAEEFQEIYEVEVTPLPTNVQYIVDYGEQKMETKKEKLESAEQISYFEPGASRPSFFKRTDFPDQVFANEDVKDSAIIEEVRRISQSGRPILVGTTSVEHSEKIHRMLQKEKIRHNVLNAKIHQSEALIVAQAGRKGAVTISTNMAGRGTDILLGGNPEGMAAELVEKALFDRSQLTTLAAHLLTEGEDAARKFAQKIGKLDPILVDRLSETHAAFEEAVKEIESVQIVGFVARAIQEEHKLDYNDALQTLRAVRGGNKDGARDYLKSINEDTIIVDEADRLLGLHGRYSNVREDDNRLAAFLAEQVFEEHYNARAALIRAVLGDDIKQAEKLTQTIPALPNTLITQILDLVADTQTQREEVWDLGGLHVIGSERHESRRIDNQLRGRAGRQGDPGSSRFFLSLEDELMRRFGGERLRNFMNRSLPEDMPIENPLLDRIIASSQERIEGYNFDIRKNVLEYDDVMAKQREATYDDRRKVLTDEADLDERIDAAFEIVTDELADNYIDNYIPFMREQISRAIGDFSAEATDDVNLRGVLTRLRNFLPVQQLDQESLEDLTPEELEAELLPLAYENEEEGRNLYQLLQAMSRFIPLLPPIPRLSATLSSRRTGHLQARNNIQKDFETQVRQIFDNFLANFVESEEKEAIWDRAMSQINDAFQQFSVQRVTREVMLGQQIRFTQQVRQALQDLLLESLSALDSEQLVDALRQYVKQERNRWRKRIGEEQFERFQRIMILSAIDREWRDYLTAADDLRREIGLESAGRQRDPKIEYKKRSFEMFDDMRNNIQKDIADKYFVQIARHEEFMRRQQAETAYREQLSSAGYQVVDKQQGKGKELRRDAPKVGRNDPCPCGSGKKYKHCHMKIDQQREQQAAAAVAVNSQPVAGERSRKKKRRRR